MAITEKVEKYPFWLKEGVDSVRSTSLESYEQLAQYKARQVFGLNAVQEKV